MSMVLLTTSFLLFLGYCSIDSSWPNSNSNNMLTVPSILQPIYHMWISNLLTCIVLTSINLYARRLNILKALIIQTLVLLKWRFWYLSKTPGILVVVLNKLLTLNVLIVYFFLIDFLNVLVTILSWVRVLWNLHLKCLAILHDEFGVAGLTRNDFSVSHFKKLTCSARSDVRLWSLMWWRLMHWNDILQLSVCILRLCRMIALHFRSISTWSISTFHVFVHKFSVAIGNKLHWLWLIWRTKCRVRSWDLFNLCDRKHSGWLRMTVDIIEGLVLCALRMSLYHPNLGNFSTWDHRILF